MSRNPAAFDGTQTGGSPAQRGPDQHPTCVTDVTSPHTHPQPLVANSPLMSWLYDIFTVNTFSSLLGVFELVTAVLIAIKPFSPKLSIVGSIMAVGLFAATISR